MEQQVNLLSDNDCKAIIAILAKKLCVRAHFITQRLMSEEDKQDMRQGELSIEALEEHIKIWVANGMPDYAHGKTETYDEEQKRLKRQKPFKKEEPEGLQYRAPFIDPRVPD